MMGERKSKDLAKILQSSWDSSRDAGRGLRAASGMKRVPLVAVSGSSCAELSCLKEARAGPSS